MSQALRQRARERDSTSRSELSVREKDTYEIVDRIGENDTNIYNSKTFDKDTSLYF